MGANMTTIKEMYDLIRRLIGKRDTSHTKLTDSKTASGKLMAGIVRDDFTSDEAAANALHADQPSFEKRIVSFRSTKYKLINKLITFLFSLNICHKTYSEYLVNEHAAKRELVAAELLQRFQRHDAMKLVASRALRKARRFQLTRVQIRCYELLRYYATLKGTTSECLEYVQLVEEASRLDQLETWSGNVKTRVKAELTEKVELSADSLQDLEGLIAELVAKTRSIQSRTLWLNCGVAAGLYYRHGGQYDLALSMHRDQLEFMQAHRHQFMPADFSAVCFYALRCSVIVRDYQQAKVFAEEGMLNQTVGDSTWFSHLSIQCLLAFHTQKWDEAIRLFRWVVEQPNFSKEPHQVEIWSIFEGYLRFFADGELTLPESTTVHGKTFQLHRLLEEIDVVRKDKTGLNVSVLIFQVLHRLRGRQFDLLESRVKALNNYLSQHLRKDKSGRFSRTDSLFKLFQIMVNSGYSLDTVRERSKNGHEYLKNNWQPDTTSGRQIEEIVPYEHIWDRVLLELEQIEQEGIFVKQYRGTLKNVQPDIVNKKDSSVKAPVES